MALGLDDLYRDIILDHYRNPRNRGHLENPDIANQGDNPLCGDEIEVSLAIADGKVVDIAFSGAGCSISQASASMMTEAIKGRPVEQIKELGETFKAMMHGEEIEIPDEASDLESLQGVRKYPVRVKCALLSWQTMLEALSLYSKSEKILKQR